MLEALILSVAVNVWLYLDGKDSAEDIGQLEQNNRQLVADLQSQEKLVQQCYVKRAQDAEAIRKSQAAADSARRKSEARAVELEKLRASSDDVDDYLSRPVPDELRTYLQDRNPD